VNYRPWLEGDTAEVPDDTVSAVMSYITR
jgi:hypothetical protein